MANSNYNIGNKLFTYIAHGVDLTENITTQYENSLIFIGDEQQIFVPKMHAYVGIGMGSYGNTINAINDLNEAIIKLQGDLNKSLISQMYAGWNKYELQKENTMTIVTRDNNGENPTLSNLALNEFSATNGTLQSMTQEITIRGIADYDPNTQLAYTSFKLGKTLDGRPTNWIPTSAESDLEIYVDPASRNNGIYASSGITVTMHHIDGVTDANGNVKGTENYIYIDDKLTWSYIASAYTYSMAFAQQYTTDAINRVYNNILGQETTYSPASLADIFVWTLRDNSDKDPDTISPAHTDFDNTDDTNYGYVFNPRGYQVYALKETANGGEYVEFPLAALITDNGTPKFVTGVNSEWIATNIGENAQRHTESLHYIDNNGNEQTIVVPSLYIRSTSWNGTYDMSIADGIETIKEVAYILDMLTDGEGTVTYISKAEYDAMTDATEKAKYNNWDYQGGDIVYWKVEQENIGIQMAYNLVSLRMDLNDAHDHIALEETGETTVRSVLATGSKLANITVIGRNQLTLTDSNSDVAGVPNGVTTYWASEINRVANPESLAATGWIGNTYTSGDMSFTLNLDLAQTYVTAIKDGIGVGADTMPNAGWDGMFGNEYYSINGTVYQKADMTNLTASANTYYELEITSNSVSIKNNAPVDADKVVTDTHYQKRYIKATNEWEPIIYYWVPDANAKVDFETNTSFTKVDLLWIRNHTGAMYWYVDENDSVPAGKIGIVETQQAQGSTIIAAVDNADGQLPKFSGYDGQTSAGQFHPTENTKFYRLSEGGTSKNLVLHPVIDNEEHIATTSWVSAVVDAKVGAIADQFDNILEQAKQYTDEKINSLDSNFLYSDFEQNVWNGYMQGSSLIPGTEAYNQTYKAFYDYYSGAQGAAQPEGWGSAQTARQNPESLYQRSRSEYIHNIIEENGIVRAESRELPSDRITVTAEVWGEGSSSKYQRTYLQVDLSQENGDVINPGSRDTVVAGDTTGATDAEKLFAFVSLKSYDNNLYVVDDTKFDYYKVPVAEYLTENVNATPAFTPAYKALSQNANMTDDTTVYIYNNGAYVNLNTLINTIQIDGWAITDIDGHTDSNTGYSTRFIQIYKKMKHFAEVDLDTIIWNATQSKIIYFVAEGKAYGATTEISSEPAANARVFKLASDGLTMTELTSVEIAAVSSWSNTTGYYTISENGSAPVLYYVQGEIGNEGTSSDPRVSETTREKEYIKASYRHVDYKHNGNGENEFNVDVKLTNIEDATRENTGLADAYDVRSFFENMFEWVDVSASVTQADNLAVSPAWYSKISFDTYYKMTNKPDIYYDTNNGTANPGHNFVKVMKASEASEVQNYGRDDNNNQIYGPAYPGATGADASSTTYTDWKMLTGTPVRQTYYVLEGTPKINPLNLTISKYVTKLYDIEYRG